MMTLLGADEREVSAAPASIEKSINNASESFMEAP
jgi:hypothetical protein